jgi:hypothetical protein
VDRLGLLKRTVGDQADIARHVTFSPVQRLGFPAELKCESSPRRRARVYTAPPMPVGLTRYGTIARRLAGLLAPEDDVDFCRRRCARRRQASRRCPTDVPRCRGTHSRAPQACGRNGRSRRASSARPTNSIIGRSAEDHGELRQITRIRQRPTAPRVDDRHRQHRQYGSCCFPSTG